jgi:hypothetical protein
MVPGPHLHSLALSRFCCCCCCRGVELVDAHDGFIIQPCCLLPNPLRRTGRRLISRRGGRLLLLLPLTLFAALRNSLGSLLEGIIGAWLCFSLSRGLRRLHCCIAIATVTGIGFVNFGWLGLRGFRAISRIFFPTLRGSCTLMRAFHFAAAGARGICAKDRTAILRTSRASTYSPCESHQEEHREVENDGGLPSAPHAPRPQPVFARIPW